MGLIISGKLTLTDINSMVGMKIIKVLINFHVNISGHTISKEVQGFSATLPMESCIC